VFVVDLWIVLRAVFRSVLFFMEVSDREELVVDLIEIGSFSAGVPVWSESLSSTGASFDKHPGDRCIDRAASIRQGRSLAVIQARIVRGAGVQELHDHRSDQLSKKISGSYQIRSVLLESRKPAHRSDYP
jgi:hypothetical protein